MKLAMLAVWRRLKRDGWLSSPWSIATPNISTPVADAAPTPPPASIRSLTPLFFPEEYAPQPAQNAPIASEESTSSVAVKDSSTRDRARLLLQIHDELLFETRREDADELAKLVVEEMTLGNPLAVPLKVDPEIGANWGEL